jgi:3-hydroxy-D-aspartate aldolase
VNSRIENPLFPDVDTPALLLDETRLHANIAILQQQAASSGLALRPHAKAHKCAHVARLQMEAGAVGLCAAKLGEAEAMADGGITDVLVTTPIVGPLKIGRLMRLAQRITVRVVVDDERNVHELARAASAAQIVLRVVIEVDVGQHRCGVDSGLRAAALAHCIHAQASLTLAGVQGYQGSLQCQADYAERRRGIVAAMDALAQSVNAIREAGFAVPVITGGGTGSFPIDRVLGCLTEVQPGSYVTMDSAYNAIDWCEAGGRMPLRAPLSILASVVSCATPGRAIIDVGWKAASSDGHVPVCRDRPDLIFEFAGDEHGLLTSSTGSLDLVPGDRIELMPGHCDTTVNLYDRFVVHAGGRVQAIWPIEARGKSN